MTRGTLAAQLLALAFLLTGDGCRRADILEGHGQVPTAPSTRVDAGGRPTERSREPRTVEVFKLGSARVRPAMLLVAKGGKSIAALAESGQEQFVMQEGHTERRRFDQVKSLSYAPDGSGLCYFGRSGPAWYLVVSRAYPREEAARYARWPFTEPILFDEKPHHMEGEPFFEAVWGPVGGCLVLEMLSRGKRRIIRDGVPFGLDYDETKGGMFSPDGRTFAFAARSGTKWFVLKGGLRVGGFYDDVGWFAFSADSRSFAFTARRAEDEFVVKDGVRVSRSYTGISELSLSADGRSFAVMVRKDGKWCVIKNDRRMGGEYDMVGVPLVWSPVGQSLAFWARRDDAGFLVIRDGALVGQVYDSVDGDGLVFSPDGRSLVFEARLGNKEFVLKDGVRVHEETDDSTGLRGIPTWPSPPCFSPDGRSCAYAVVSKGRRQHVMRDGQRVGQDYESVSDLTFSPDGRTLVFLARDRGKMLCVRDGVRVGEEFERMSRPTISDDGTKLIFAGLRDNTVYRCEVPW